MNKRISTGLSWLDKHLGGGLIPGTLCLVLGATGIGKTHLGLHFAHHNIVEQAKPGIIFDLLSRGDSQNHQNYAQQLFQWNLSTYQLIDYNQLWEIDVHLGHYSKMFEDMGKKVHQSQLSEEDWYRWQLRIQKQIHEIALFFYAHFIRGVKKVVIDGIEPVINHSDSAQHELFDYIYHKVIKSEDQWLAREVLREKYLAQQSLVQQHGYNEKEITTVFLQTTEEVLLSNLIERKIPIGGLEANANTIIMMGKSMDKGEITRQLYIAKHRGSFATNKIIAFEINDYGLVEKEN